MRNLPPSLGIKPDRPYLQIQLKVIRANLPKTGLYKLRMAFSMYVGIVPPTHDNLNASFILPKTCTELQFDDDRASNPSLQLIVVAPGNSFFREKKRAEPIGNLSLQGLLSSPWATICFIPTSQFPIAPLTKYSSDCPRKVIVKSSFLQIYQF